LVIGFLSSIGFAFVSALIQGTDQSEGELRKIEEIKNELHLFTARRTKEDH
jgi:hypothetical protein